MAFDLLLLLLLDEETLLLPGRFSLSPGCNWSPLPVMPLAFFNAATVVPYRLAMFDRLSPLLTVCDLGAAGCAFFFLAVVLLLLAAACLLCVAEAS